MRRNKTCCEKISTSISSTFNTLYYRVVGKIKNNKSWTLQAVAYLTTLGYVVGSSYNAIVEEQENVSVAIAKSTGAAIKFVLMPTIIAPVCRVLTSSLQGTNLARYIGINQKILSHKCIANLTVVAATIHSISHYIANADNYHKQTGITGIVMLSALAIPLGGMFLVRKIESVRNTCSYGMQIIRPHQLGATLFLICYGFHTEDLRLMIYAGGIFSGYALDKIIAFIKYKHVAHTHNIVMLENTDFISLKIERPPHFKITVPGDYALLSLPKINKVLEVSHPFTIVNDDNKTLEFLIKKNGIWTNKLWQLLTESKDLPPMRWSISGPYSSKLGNFYRKSHLTIIGMGIGITPYLSYMNWLLCKNSITPVLNIYISQRKIAEIIIFINLLKKISIQNFQIIKSVNFYLTKPEADIKTKIKDLSADSVVDFKIVDSENIELKLIKEAEETKIEPALSVIAHNSFSLFNTEKRKSSQHENVHKLFSINLHLNKRMNVDHVVAQADDEISICGNAEFSAIATQYAYKYHKKISRESF